MKQRWERFWTWLRRSIRGGHQGWDGSYPPPRGVVNTDDDPNRPRHRRKF